MTAPQNAAQMMKYTNAQLEAKVRDLALATAAKMRELAAGGVIVDPLKSSLFLVVDSNLSYLYVLALDRFTRKMTAVEPDRAFFTKAVAAVYTLGSKSPDPKLVETYASEIVRLYAPATAKPVVLGAGLIWPLGAGAVGYVLGGWPAGLLGAALGYLVSRHGK